MNIKIEIDCDTIDEFYGHLTKIRMDIKKQARKLKLDPLRDEFPKTVNLNDDNCYGEHYVKIKPEDVSINRKPKAKKAGKI